MTIVFDPGNGSNAQLYGRAMEVQDQAEATAYLDALVEWAWGQPENRDKTSAEVRAIMLHNLGYYSGYHGHEVQARVERLFKAVHPVFGSVDGPQLTADQVYAAGQALAAHHVRRTSENWRTGETAKEGPPNVKAVLAERKRRKKSKKR